MSTATPGDLCQEKMEAGGSWDTTQSREKLVADYETHKKNLWLYLQWGQAMTQQFY